jgi:hypothetical protein
MFECCTVDAGTLAQGWGFALVAAYVLLAGAVGALVLALMGDSEALARPAITARRVLLCAGLAALGWGGAALLAGLPSQLLTSTPWFPLVVATSGLGLYRGSYAAGRAVARPGRVSRQAAAREIGEPWGETLSIGRSRRQSAGGRAREAAPRRVVEERGAGGR